MSPLRLFTAFHGNLDFSALPDADRPRVISRCYWPLLSLAEDHGLRLGFELSARTLATLQAEDPEWVKRFRGLAERGLVEPIASGWAQIVAPLAPVEVNRANLALGRAVYAEILGFVPETFFVHEQTFSDGLVPLFEEAGARAVVMEWNNPAAHQPALRPLRCRPARLASEGGAGPVLLWNDSIVFQKVQRYAQGVIPRAELTALTDRLCEAPGAETLCLYGGDVEIFDYRPSRPLPPAREGEGEMDRLVGLLRGFAADPRFELVLPREIVEQAEALPEVSLGCAADPIPCKKQPRYNPTRWAVSGRDGFGMNTRCHALLRSERAVRRLTGAPEAGQVPLELVDLWRSDFRTRATEEKIVEFETGSGVATARSRERLARATPALAEGEDLVVVNPGEGDWDGMPVEIPLRLAAGRFFEVGLRVRRGEPLPAEAYQVEVSGRHRDGSVREATLVLEPSIAAGGLSAFELVPAAPLGSPDESGAEVARIETSSVRLDLLPHRGAAIEALAFPEIWDAPLLGTIAHGSFDSIAYTPDFYTGHVVAVGETGAKRADLEPVCPRLRGARSGPVRASIEATLETPLGVWHKIHHVYRKRPRVDLIHELAFHEARLASLRLGIFTLQPRGFDRGSLRFGTVNGGPRAEWRELGPGLAIEQSRAVSAAVSATSCLGATEGWVAIEDRDKGLLIERHLAEAATAPMLDFAEVDDLFFCRLGHSAAETDETRATFVRGKRRFAFSVLGYRAGAGDPATDARRRHEGLVYRTERGVGVTSHL